MKKLKNVIIYGVIAVLIVAAFGGYFIQSHWHSSASQSVSASVEAENGQILSTKDGDNIKNLSETAKQNHIKQVMAKSAAASDANPVVGIGRGTDFASVTSTAVKNAGGLSKIIKKGDVVAIKVNLCVQTQNYGSPMTTDYRVTQEVINIARECGASKVIVVEGNFNSNAFLNEGNKYSTLKGAVLYNFNDCDTGDCYKLQPANSLTGTSIYIPKLYMDADVVIDVAKMKTHFITGVSLGLKNSIGVPSYKIYQGSGDKGGLHALGIEKVIVDLNRIRRPDFVVVDGIIGGEGFGPYENTPVKSNIIIAGRNVVAVDTVGLNFMGFSVSDINVVQMAAQSKVGIDDLSKIKIIGANLNSIKMKFTTGK